MMRYKKPSVLYAGLWLSACQLWPAAGHAADRLGTPVIEVCEIAALHGNAASRDLAVAGEVLFLDKKTLVVRDKDYHRQRKLVDILDIDASLRARLSHECSQSWCSEIVTGRVVGTVLHAKASEPYESTFQSPAACRHESGRRLW